MLLVVVVWWECFVGGGRCGWVVGGVVGVIWLL